MEKRALLAASLSLVVVLAYQWLMPAPKRPAVRPTALAASSSSAPSTASAPAATPQPVAARAGDGTAGHDRICCHATAAGVGDERECSALDRRRNQHRHRLVRQSRRRGDQLAPEALQGPHGSAGGHHSRRRAADRVATVRVQGRRSRDDGTAQPGSVSRARERTRDGRPRGGQRAHARHLRVHRCAGLDRHEDVRVRARRLRGEVQFAGTRPRLRAQSRRALGTRPRRHHLHRRAEELRRIRAALAGHRLRGRQGA